MNTVTSPPPTPEPYWTPEEHLKLAKLSKKRLNATQIAKLLGRDVGNVRREAERLGILLYKI